MAMDVGGAKGGVKSDINVTPLVDVMLVLLIIMMLVAPLLQQGVKMTLPTAYNTAEKPDTQDQTAVFIDVEQQAVRQHHRGRRGRSGAAAHRRCSRKKPSGPSTSRVTRTRRTAPS